MKLLLVLAFLALIPSEAQCSLCRKQGQECRFDVTCGVSCWCYKSEWRVKGVCVPRD